MADMGKLGTDDSVCRTESNETSLVIFGLPVQKL